MAPRGHAAAPAGTPSRLAASMFSLLRARPGEGAIATGLGIYLGYAVVRFHEVFPKLNVPRLPLILTIVFALCLVLAVPAEGWRQIWKKSRSIKLVALIAVLAVLSIPLGIWMSGSLDFLLNRFFITITVFLACAVFLRDRRLLRRTVVIYLMAVGAVTAKAVIFPDPEVLSEEEQDERDRRAAGRAEMGLPPPVYRMSVGISLDPNDFGSVLVSAIPLALWLGVGSMRRRIIWTGVALLLVAGIVPTASRTALLGLIAVAGTLVLQGESFGRKVLFAILVAGGGVVFVGTMTEAQGARFGAISTQDYNVQGEGRLSFWRQGMIWMVKRPTGYGLNNFGTFYGWMNERERAAHNSFVQYAVDLGLAGLVSFILLWHTVLAGSSRHRRKAIRLAQVAPALSKDEAALGGHVLACLVGTVVTGFFLSNGYLALLYMPLGLATALLLGSPLEALTPSEGPAPVSAPPAGAGWRSRGSEFRQAVAAGSPARSASATLALPEPPAPVS